MQPVSPSHLSGSGRLPTHFGLPLRSLANPGPPGKELRLGARAATGDLGRPLRWFAQATCGPTRTLCEPDKRGAGTWRLLWSCWELQPVVPRSVPDHANAPEGATGWKARS